MTALEIKRLQVPYRRDFLRTLARPFEMLVLEPIVVCFLAYLTLVVRELSSCTQSGPSGLGRD